jgi:hypothetical protein
VRVAASALVIAAAALFAAPAQGSPTHMYAPAAVKVAFEHELGFELVTITGGGGDMLALFATRSCPDLSYAMAVSVYRSVPAARTAWRWQLEGWRFSGYTARRLANVIVAAAGADAEIGVHSPRIAMPPAALRALSSLSRFPGASEAGHRVTRFCPA